MRFLVDNSLPSRMADQLAAMGHEAAHVRELNLSRAIDEEIFEVATRENRILLAQDTDFGTILAQRGESRPSVVLFRTRAKSPERLLPVLTENLSRLEEDLTAGAVVVFEDARIRVRRLPLFGGPGPAT